ncbi:MAG: hypothetical protein J0I32_09150 [Sphingobacteriales bacterium]|nr:hypothetical protein [Sphingobacteriales bacterium]OJW00164.1 MAG: hypothetical protein BGO52_03495 [Sphingobacteriales bacterium 44-61]
MAAVTPNIQFTLLVKIEGRLREFNFRKRSAQLYDVDTADEKGARFQFNWKEVDGAWEITSLANLPDWIRRNTSSLREKFHEHLL